LIEVTDSRIALKNERTEQCVLLSPDHVHSYTSSPPHDDSFEEFVSTKNLILPEITRLEAVRSEVDVAICDLGVVTMGSFSVRCRTRPFEGR
jgi:hypothetical protein